jgi:hypothetical protein
VNNGRVSYETVKVYACAWHRDRGDAVCSNGLRRPVEPVNQAMIEWLKEHVLREEVIAEALKELRRRLVERAKTRSSRSPSSDLRACCPPHQPTWSDRHLHAALGRDLEKEELEAPLAQIEQVARSAPGTGIDATPRRARGNDACVMRSAAAASGALHDVGPIRDPRRTRNRPRAVTPRRVSASTRRTKKEVSRC